MSFNMNLAFGPRWDDTATLRDFLTKILSSGIVIPEDAEKVAMATSELVENLVKYSTIGGSAIFLEKDYGADKITLMTKNIADTEKLEMFVSVFDEIKEGDPQEIFKKMMLRSLTDPDTSQLGLARIRCECCAEVSYELSDDLEQVIIPPDITYDATAYRLLCVTIVIPVKLISENM